MNVNPISHSQIMAHQNKRSTPPESRIHLTNQELSLSGDFNQNQGSLAALVKVASYLDEESALNLKMTSISLRAVVRGNVQCEARYTIRFFDYVSNKIVAEMDLLSENTNDCNHYIARSLAIRGDFDRALIYAKRSDVTLGRIAKQYALQGNHLGADKTLAQISDRTLHDYAYKTIVKKLAQNGDYELALTYADNHLFLKRTLYEIISQEQVTRGDDESAFNNIELLERDPSPLEMDPEWRIKGDYLYEVIALQQAKRGHFDVALGTAMQIPIVQDRKRVIRKIEQIRSGRAIYAQRIKKDKRAFYANAFEQLKKNDFKGCLDTIDALPAKQRQVEALQNVATVIDQTKVQIVI